MHCQCGIIAQYSKRDGKPGVYICAQRRCKFLAANPTRCEGYHRLVLPTTALHPETVIVRFEALEHPLDEHKPAVMAVCEGSLYEGHVGRMVLEDSAYEGKWDPARKAYIYTLPFYAPLLSRLQQFIHNSGGGVSCSTALSSTSLLLEPIPTFFFKCIDQGNQLARSFQHVTPDKEDIVYQQLQEFQKKGVQFLLQHGGRGLIADEMGLGKTVQAIATAHFYRDEWPFLVVCPMSLMENWGKEICRFCSIPFSRIGFVQGRKGNVELVHDVVIASYASLEAVNTSMFQVVIFDESHYIKGADSKRTKTALAIAKQAKRVILLSGTPTLSRPMELYTQLSAIAHSSGILPSSTQYAARYCNAHVSPIGRGGAFSINTDGHSHTDELHLLLRHFMIRRSKRELGNALPSKSRQITYVTVDEKGKNTLAKQVSALRKTVAADSSGGVELSARTQNAFELKVATAQAKIPSVKDYVVSAVEKHRMAKEKVIVFAHHQCMMEAIKDAVETMSKKHPVDYILIAGETPSAQREKLADHFRDDPHCVVAILSMQSSGVGHNFTCASTVIFAELDWNPSTHLQCEDRVHRMGQSKPCIIQYLLAEGTSDSVIWPLLNSKLSVTTAVLSGVNETGDGVGKFQVTTEERRVFTKRDGSGSQHHISTQKTLDGFLSTPVGASQSRGKGCPSTPSPRPSSGNEPEVLTSPRCEQLAPLLTFEVMKQNSVWRDTAYSRPISGVASAVKPSLALGSAKTNTVASLESFAGSSNFSTNAEEAEKPREAKRTILTLLGGAPPAAEEVRLENNTAASGALPINPSPPPPSKRTTFKLQPSAPSLVPASVSCSPSVLTPGSTSPFPASELSQTVNTFKRQRSPSSAESAPTNRGERGARSPMPLLKEQERERYCNLTKLVSPAMPEVHCRVSDPEKLPCTTEDVSQFNAVGVVSEAFSSKMVLKESSFSTPTKTTRRTIIKIGSVSRNPIRAAADPVSATPSTSATVAGTMAQRRTLLRMGGGVPLSTLSPTSSEIAAHPSTVSAPVLPPEAEPIAPCWKEGSWPPPPAVVADPPPPSGYSEAHSPASSPILSESLLQTVSRQPSSGSSASKPPRKTFILKRA